MLVPWKALNGMRRHMAQCNRGVERNRYRLAAEEEKEVVAKAFNAYGIPLEMVASFKYLGRVISAADDDWPYLAKNLSWERTLCRRMLRIISRA